MAPGKKCIQKAAERTREGEIKFSFQQPALHAAEITFVHPVMLKSMTLQAPLPADMLRLKKLLESSEFHK